MLDSKPDIINLWSTRIQIQILLEPWDLEAKLVHDLFSLDHVLITIIFFIFFLLRKLMKIFSWRKKTNINYFGLDILNE